MATTREALWGPGSQGCCHCHSEQGERYIQPEEKPEHSFQVQPWEDSQDSTSATLSILRPGSSPGRRHLLVGQKQKPCQQHWDLLSAVKVSWSSWTLSLSFSSLTKLWWFARIFSTRNRAASSMFMLSYNAEMRTRMNSKDSCLEESTKSSNVVMVRAQFVRGTSEYTGCQLRPHSRAYTPSEFNAIQ